MRIAWSWARWRRYLARFCVWLAVAGAVAAMARPSVAVEPAGREGILELVVDVSGSMQADDIAPTRLGAVQRATLRLLDQLPRRVRVGLISFSSTPGTQARPTTDRAALRERIAALVADGSTATGDALQRALDDIGASRPAAPAWIVLISDGTSTQPGDPVDVASVAAARHIPILAAAVGRPDAMVTVLDANGSSRRIPVPPDLFQLTRVAGATGGRALAAQSAPELETALDDLFRRTDLGSEQRDLTMLFAAGALLLLAIGRALAPARGWVASGTHTRSLAALWVWAFPVALAVTAGVTSIAWAQWRPTNSPPAIDSATTAKLATRPLPVPPAIPPTTTLPPSPFVEIDAATRSDRTIVQQAATLLRSHGMLATQRTAEIKRQHLTEIAGLEVSACDVCVTTSLTSPSSGFYPTANGRPVCDVLLNTPFVRKQANVAHVPVRRLVAMAMLHRQEQCMHNDDSRSLPFNAEQRLASELHNARLFDLLYAQIDARQRDWPMVEQAVALLREHMELAPQRASDLRRRRLNQVGPLQIGLCRGCRGDRGLATPGYEVQGLVRCNILLDMAVIERDARGWSVPMTQAVASTLVHEQEHCVRAPDDRETPALDEERRLARKLGNPRQLEYVTSLYSNLDRSGHWKS